MSYKNLEIWKLADELVVEIHEMTIAKLPKFVYSPGSNDETIDHSENFFKTRSLQDESLCNYLHARLETHGKKINFLSKEWTMRTGNNQAPVTNNQ